MVVRRYTEAEANAEASVLKAEGWSPIQRRGWPPVLERLGFEYRWGVRGWNRDKTSYDDPGGPDRSLFVRSELSLLIAGPAIPAAQQHVDGVRIAALEYLAKLPTCERTQKLETYAAAVSLGASMRDALRLIGL